MFRYRSYLDSATLNAINDRLTATPTTLRRCPKLPGESADFVITFSGNFWRGARGEHVALQTRSTPPMHLHASSTRDAAAKDSVARGGSGTSPPWAPRHCLPGSPEGDGQSIAADNSHIAVKRRYSTHLITLSTPKVALSNCHGDATCVPA